MRRIILLALAICCVAAVVPSASSAAVVSGPIGATAPFPDIEPGWLDQPTAFVPDCWGFTGYTCIQTRSGELLGWNDWIKIGACAAGIGWFIAGNIYLIAKVKKLGGAWRVGKRIIKSSNRTKAIRDFFGYASGVGGVISACT